VNGAGDNVLALVKGALNRLEEIEVSDKDYLDALDAVERECRSRRTSFLESKMDRNGNLGS
jgi:hypothetical protein